MGVKFLNLYSQYLSIKDEIDDVIQSSIKNSQFIGGDLLENFNREFAHYNNAKFCVGVGNGTDALEIALECLDLPIGSEVLIPANSFIATSESVTRNGLKIIFVDVDKNDFTIDISDLERKITNKSSAIIVVHLYGHPCNMNEIIKIANKKNLKIIEDCAQAHGATYESRKVGTFGDIGCFSFYPGKNLGCYGDGGAIITDDEVLANKCKMIANHGRLKKFDHLYEGRNSRLDSIQAGILSVKLKYLNEWIEKRNTVANFYKENLAGFNEIKLPVTKINCYHSYHLFVIKIGERDALRKYLKERNIETGIHYPKSLPELEAYNYAYFENSTPISNSLSKQILSLPIGEHLTLEEVNEVSSAIKDFLMVCK